MKSLYIGNSVQILPSYLQPEGTFSDSDSEHEHDGNVYEKQGFILRAPQLRKLCIRDLFVTRGPTYFDLLLKPLPELTHLDLSGAFHKEGMENFCWLLCLPELVSLILHNVQGDHPPTFFIGGLSSVMKLFPLKSFIKGTYEKCQHGPTYPQFNLN